MEVDGRMKPAGAGTRLLHALGVGAALIWLLTAVTGIILAYHFVLKDRIISPVAPPKDLAGIERVSGGRRGA